MDDHGLARAAFEAQYCRVSNWAHARYAIRRDGSLSVIGSTAFTNVAGAVDARLSPDGTFLFVTGGRGQVVSGFAVKGSDVTELPGSPTALPAGTAPTGIVVL